MIDINRDEIIPLDELLDELPDPPARTTRWRWCESGIGGVRLETVKIGRRRYTSRAAFQRFVNTLSGANAGEMPAPLPEHREAAAKKRRLAQADRRLAELNTSAKRAAAV